MSKEELISSGLLEIYLLGNASPEEIKKIQEMEKLYPEVTREIEKIEASLIGYGEAFADAPSFELKNKIQKKLNVPGSKEANIVAGSSFLRYAVAASIALLIGSIIMNYMLYSRLNSAKRALADLNNERSVLADQFKTLQTNYDNKSSDLAMLMDPSNKMVSLKGMGSAPTAAATILWSMKDKSVYINVASLPMPPSGMQYQLWAIVDGKPMDAGVFNMTEGSFVMQKMKTMENASAFAVTLEKVGGSPTPNMAAMYLMGTV